MGRNLAVPAASSQPAVYEPTNEAEKLRDLAYAGRLLSSIRTHWRLFCIVFLGFVALVVGGTLLVPKQYTATAKMIVGAAQSEADAQSRYSALPVLNALTLESSDQSADTVAELVQEGPVVDRVVEALHLNTSPAQLLGRVSVKPVLNTPVLSLSATWSNPDQAALIANTFSSVLVERERDLVSSQAVAAQDYLNNAISDAQRSLQAANGALSAFQAKTQIADINTQTQALLARVEADESKVDQLQDDQKQAQAQLASAQSEMGTMSATIAGQQATDVNPAMTQLRQQLADVEVQLATARKRYTEKHPAVIALEQQRDQLIRQMDAEPATVAGQVIAVPNPVYQQLAQQEDVLRSQISGDAAQIKQLRAQRRALGPQIAALPAQTAKLGFLQERAKLASDVYTALEQKYDDAVVAANSAISDVTLVQPANAQDAAVTPNLLFNTAVGIAIGLILAFLAVAIADAYQRRIREDDDVERAVGLPVIAHIPSMTAKDLRALPWLQTVTVEAFLHLCASLRILGQRSGARVIVVTSPEKGEGKTTIAYQLATAMSRIRSTVLLIDADMRCPAAHKQANIENASGLADVICGTATFDNAVVHFTQTLDLLPAGPMPHNPVALIESIAFDDVLELARKRYECVIIDTPAVSPVVDAALIASRADATALVLSANGSHEALARQAATRLHSLGVDNVIGVIMNRVKTKFSDYSDYFNAGPRPLAKAPGAGATPLASAVLDEAPRAATPATSVTVVVPAYNEGTPLARHLLELTRAFDGVSDFASVDYVIVDDGSTDETFEIARQVAQERDDMVVLRHTYNRGLGAALRTAFRHARGELVLTVDSDLSYSTDVLIGLLRTAVTERADVVMASAYMKGGQVRGVPWMRAFLSREANRFLSLATGGRYATLTCMVRAYRREFVTRLSFDVDGMDVNAELVFQTLRANGTIVEIPATLQWPEHRKRNAGRANLVKICKLTWNTMTCGLRYRPALVLGIPGLIPGLLPAVIAVMFAMHFSPRSIAIGSVATMVIQYGSLAILGGQALTFLRRRHLAPRTAFAEAPRPHLS